MSENNALVPAVVSKSIIPKPRKHEIIEALVILRIKELAEQNIASRKRREQLTAKINPALLKFYKKHFNDLARVYSMGYDSTNPSMGIKIQLDNSSPNMGFSRPEIPAELQVLIKERQSISDVRIDRDRIKKEIARALCQQTPESDRVDAMLENKDSREALNKMLDALTGRTTHEIKA